MLKLKSGKELKDNKTVPYYYFEDEVGNRSDNFAYAESFSDGYALIRIIDTGSYYFMDKNGNLSEPFKRASGYVNGFARVLRHDVYGEAKGWQFRNKQGALSEEFVMIDNYAYNNAIVIKSGDNMVQFRDIDGNLSEKFEKVGRYIDGYALVKRISKSSAGKQFRDIQGNLSEIFQIAKPYKEGMAVVKLKKDKGYRYRNRRGELSEDLFFEASDYGESGFAIVRKTENSPKEVRDLLGNVTSRITVIGTEYLDYIKDRKTLFDLDDVCFLDDKFLKTIMEREQHMLLQAYEHCQTSEDYKKLRELAEYIGEYLKDKVLEVDLQKKRNSKKNDESIFDEKDTLDAIQKMF